MEDTDKFRSDPIHALRPRTKTEKAKKEVRRSTTTHARHPRTKTQKVKKEVRRTAAIQTMKKTLSTKISSKTIPMENFQLA